MGQLTSGREDINGIIHDELLLLKSMTQDAQSSLDFQNQMSCSVLFKQF
jgi:hypothetical protein